jgi:hypothetical protein
MNHYTTNEIREAVIAELKDKHQPSYYLSLITKTEEVNALLDAAFKRLPDRLPDDTLEFDNACVEVKDAFVIAVSGGDFDIKFKTICETLIIMYDQCRDRLKDRLPDDTKTMDDRLSTDVSGSVSFPKCKPKCCGREMYPCGGVLGKRPDGKIGDVEHLWRCDICKQETNDLLS